MRHHNQNRTLGRSRSQRTALLRGLALSLIEHEKIQTTEAKAKELRPYVEKLITKGKEGTLTARRLVQSSLGEPHTNIVKKLFDDVSKRYVDRNGGYTRIIKLGDTGAGRTEAYIELV
ncbi:MAG: 50S ribosomal protein L17 [Candidatus Pacebacteria bacterium]|nr:50S ribosomal protein L17 [Candidatus Paceibacterota bacterium]MCF7857072.1 50S ribosomal protein L17 [Candidatus Paceibacterota bacterium]